MRNSAQGIALCRSPRRVQPELPFELISRPIQTTRALTTSRIPRSCSGIGRQTSPVPDSFACSSRSLQLQAADPQVSAFEHYPARLAPRILAKRGILVHEGQIVRSDRLRQLEVRSDFRRKRIDQVFGQRD